MLSLWEIPGRSRRRHWRLLRRVRAEGWIYIRNWHEFRIVERLHHAGLVTACVSKGLFSSGPYPFRELAVFADEAEARRQYPSPLPRRPR